MPERETRVRYQIVYMNRSRYKDPKTGKLEIKYPTDKYESLEKAEKDYALWDKAGYALKLREVTEYRCECLNLGGSKVSTSFTRIAHSAFPSAPRILKTNERWDYRMMEYQIEKAKKDLALIEQHRSRVECLIEIVNKNQKPNYCILTEKYREKLCTGCGRCA